jgi:hypothetical protein
MDISSSRLEISLEIRKETKLSDPKPTIATNPTSIMTCGFFKLKKVSIKISAMRNNVKTMALGMNNLRNIFAALKVPKAPIIHDSQTME